MGSKELKSLVITPIDIFTKTPPCNWGQIFILDKYYNLTPMALFVKNKDLTPIVHD